MAETANIRLLKIDRYRGIEKFAWRPGPGMNVILGGGDVGKTTILEAISLLLSPSNATVVSESDYWRRDNTSEFVIEVVMSLPESSEISTQHNFSWPWAWDGENAVLPAVPETGEDDIPAPDDPVYLVRVRGTTELELIWEIVQPHDATNHFSVAVRRQIGLVRLSADDRNDRDLRLVYGSALDRIFADTALRARIGKRVSELDLHDSLGDNGKETLGKLDKRLTNASLPHDLRLGVTTSQGLSIGALIGLLAGKDGVTLPLASWGAGTRRMATLEIASAREEEASITVIDEIERGLEPYRLRKLIATLQGGLGQVFVTTHSPVAIACAKSAHLWYLDSVGHIGALPYKKIAPQQRRDPETFLAKVAVIAEGPTEVGFLRFLLKKAFTTDPLDYGVRVCDGQGNDATLDLLETLSTANLLFAGLADDERRNPLRWQTLKLSLGDRLHQWKNGCTEQHVIAAVAEKKLPEFLKDKDGDLDGQRLRTLADRLGIQNKKLTSIEQTLATRGETLRQLITEAATGSTAGAPEGSEKEWKSHARCWFKSESGGRELADKMVALGAWETIGPVLLPLITSILKAAGLPECEKLEL